MQIYPAPAPDDVVESWEAAIGDVGISLRDVALMWRRGRPRRGGHEAASWRPDSDIELEFDDDDDFIPALAWANSDSIRVLRRVMVWVERTPEGLAGLLRHELEHTVQIAADVNLDLLHRRALEEIQRCGGTSKSYNAIPMEVDANRAAARFLRRRYGSDRLSELIIAGDTDAACFRPTANPESLDTLADRMKDFILNIGHDNGFVRSLECGPLPT